MELTPQTQAVLLLTAHFSKLSSGVRPLSPTEWGRFAQWLRNQGLSPEALLSRDPSEVLPGWQDKTVTAERIRQLIARAGALGFAVEKWDRAGLWILTRSDVDYPIRLKKRLRADSPPLLFGCGNRKLLNGECVAVVGSRDASHTDVEFANGLGRAAAEQGLSIVSGAARGIDEAAMLGALESEGTVIGVLAEGLLKASTSAKYRKSLMSKNLVLLSPFYPEAGFDVGNAMSRNKYVYCLSDVAIVVSSSKEKGGTWNGAIENLRASWVPLWVKEGGENSGNAALVGRGAHFLPEGMADLRSLLYTSVDVRTSKRSSDLFDNGQRLVDETSRSETSERLPAGAGERVAIPPKAVEPPSVSAEALTMSFYGLFLKRLRELTVSGPATVEDLLREIDVGKGQLQSWLKRGIKERRVQRLRKPVRYQSRDEGPKQTSMFESD